MNAIYVQFIPYAYLVEVAIGLAVSLSQQQTQVTTTHDSTCNKRLVYELNVDYLIP